MPGTVLSNNIPNR